LLPLVELLPLLDPPAVADDDPPAPAALPPPAPMRAFISTN
jgi:hypothetical protein